MADTALPRIRRLPPETVNRIAAGEVIERPASAVKELVENALDAGARHVAVAVEGGGRNLIEVADDGVGMDRDQLALAIERHATSKLPEDDLVHIRQLGFRGEALPSIGSVGRLLIQSRARGADAAWQIAVEGGAVGPVEPAARQAGTRVVLRDLFYATPARLKFLKTDRAELDRIGETLRRLAMAHPAVGFTLSEGGRQVLRLDPAEGDLLDGRRERLAQILGRDFVASAVAIDARRETLSLSGLASLPTFHRRTNRDQHLFVNGRPVRDRLLLGALRGAYLDVLAHDRHPAVALFLELPPEEVDVNVHPTKAEVRFRDPSAIRGLIVGAIRHALAAAGPRTATTPAQSALAAFRAPTWPSPSGAMAEGAALFQAPLAARAQEAVPNPAPTPEYPLGVARGQVHGTYIVAETKDGLILVDQHAAHERLMLEKIAAGLGQGGVARQ
ncbi:MAG: DNA mismatch repair endonuclease MutL, partial [Alphaproteobacteria bacterium]|nr:DNA mismatch repair endonuclease MutL [Alphaproteobacteria bacterium]